jgi:hypothetical protein
VADPSGSVLPRTTVTATNLATTAAATAETDSDGKFVFKGIAPGTYKIAIERTGYHNFVQEKVDVADGTKTVMNIQLQNDNFRYMFYGFLAAWLIVTAYIAVIAARERKLKSELARVGRMVEQGGAKR